MKIKTVSIHNFRSVRDTEFDLEDYSLLVGPNNAGKSTVIDALRVFYEKDKYGYRPDRDVPFLGSDGESWIDITFALLPQEHKGLADKYKAPDFLLKVRKYLNCKDKSKNGLIYAFLPEGDLASDQFYGAKQVQQGKLGNVVYVPAVSKVDEHIKLTGPSALRDLLSTVLDEVIDSSNAFVELEKNFIQFSKTIRNASTTDGLSLGGLEEDLSSLLGEWGTEFHFSVKTPTISDITKSLIDFHCRDESHEQDMGLDQFGSGFQRHFIFSLIQLSAKYLGKKKPTQSKDFSPQLNLLLFEEPEAFLHPSKQQKLALNLQSIAKDETSQVICSTHSPHFISHNISNIGSVLRLRRVGGIGRVYQVRKDRWNSIVEQNQELNEIASKWNGKNKPPHEDDYLPEMESIKYCLWLNPDRCGMFFANRVLLVEGATEIALINRLITDGKIRIPDDGLQVVDCMGKFNTHRFILLLSELGTPHAVLHDADLNKGQHSELHELVRKSSHAKLTCRIEKFGTDLEDTLGISKTTRHRKPQHALMNYERGDIEDSRVADLCKKVQDCIDSMANS
ncbi:AAA family ATPase [Gimesia sp.]|uniref:ATP-dependent nuclease n=1 Tax=Gimesia sp. TaxID=2024833 RepID=UPI0032EDD50A